MRLIDADKLKKDFGEQRLDHDFCICGDESTARDLIDDAETVESEPIQHGKWIVPDGTSGMFWRCSVCGERNMYRIFRYCPNCGSKMN